MNEPFKTHPAPAANPFSLVTALSDAFTYVLAGFPNFLRLSWKFLLFAVVAAALFFVAIGFFARSENEVGLYVASGCAIFLGLLVSVAYYIVVARNWLLGETAPRFLPVYPAFLLRVVVLTVLLLAVMAAIFGPVIAAGIAGFGYFDDSKSELSTAVVVLAVITLIVVAIFAVIAGLYIAGRLMPWMVAAAIEKPQTLGEAWRATKGAGLRIMAGMLGLTVLFMIVDTAIETALSPLLGIRSDAFENIAASGVSLIALFVLLLSKILIYFPQTAASMVYCASVYRQTSGG